MNTRQFNAQLQDSVAVVTRAFLLSFRRFDRRLPFLLLLFPLFQVTPFPSHELLLTSSYAVAVLEMLVVIPGLFFCLSIVLGLVFGWQVTFALLGLVSFLPLVAPTALFHREGIEAIALILATGVVFYTWGRLRTFGDYGLVSLSLIPVAFAPFYPSCLPGQYLLTERVFWLFGSRHTMESPFLLQLAFTSLALAWISARPIASSAMRRYFPMISTVALYALYFSVWYLADSQGRATPIG
ncbi:MAG: hypothetical protein IT290_00660 [Deltaproteobacteria bacterium]|nr:hypothetical protein [Deltaproteobacteria bacterium]